MKHKRFEENILIDEAYTNYGNPDKNADQKKSQGIAKHFAETLEYEEKKKWFHQLPQEPGTISKNLTQDQIEEIRKEASSALHGDTLAYETKSNRSGSSDHQWARTLLNKGAIGDRVAAATVLIQDNPLYNLTALRNLVNSVKPAKKKDGIIVIDALSELLISDLLIPDVKLRTFDQHPLGHLDEMTSGNKQARRNILKLWYYEDQLKELYGTYVEALNKFAHDTVEANKEKAVSAMSYLLMHHPEREKMLLTNIINKMGDPSASVASKVVYHLCQLLYNHPNMKSVVLNDIEKMLFRSNISPRAQYYGICFLNQFFLGKDDSKIAENLIRIYFSFFKASIKKGEIESRLMCGILTGVKRAFRFAGAGAGADAVGGAHVGAVHALVHVAGAGVAVHALALLQHASDPALPATDRYYTSLYRKLTCPEIFNTTHSALLFSLIYKSLKQDKNINRVAAFVKRLLQLCCHLSPAQACGILFLISQVLKDSDKKEALTLVCAPKEIKEEIKKEETEVSPESEQKKDNGESNKTEEGGDGSVIKNENRKMDLLKGDKKDLLIDDDEEENYVDLKIDEDGNVKPKKRKRCAGSAGWHHARVKRERGEGEGEERGQGERERAAGEREAAIQLKRAINADRVASAYSPWSRDPSHAGARTAAAGELRALARHHHPTVRLFAAALLRQQIIHYSGDPLKDFAGIRFLDRFVFKNPKRRVVHDDDHQGVKKVKGSHPKFAIRKNYVPRGLKSVAVNSASYLNEDAKKIPVDEKFLYDFLQQRRAATRLDADGDGDEDSDAASVASEDFERYLDSLTGAPPAAADSDEELDYLGELEAAKQKTVVRKRKAAADDLDQLDDDLSNGDEDDDDGDLVMSGDDEEPSLSGDERDRGGDNLGSLFASAEEFSTLLEESATSWKQGSSGAVSNKDNSSLQQLAWEEKRDTWIKGFNKKGGKYKRKNKK